MLRSIRLRRFFSFTFWRQPFSADASNEFENFAIVCISRSISSLSRLAPLARRPSNSWTALSRASARCFSASTFFAIASGC